VGRLFDGDEWNFYELRRGKVTLVWRHGGVLRVGRRSLKFQRGLCKCEMSHKCCKALYRVVVAHHWSGATLRLYIRVRVNHVCWPTRQVEGGVKRGVGQGVSPAAFRLSPPLLLLNYRVTVYTVTNTAYDTRHLLLVL
jgi:hypothetical protein